MLAQNLLCDSPVLDPSSDAIFPRYQERYGSSWQLEPEACHELPERRMRKEKDRR
jgi:hypothetical protein